MLIDFVAPKELQLHNSDLPVVILNDGQDLEALGFLTSIDDGTEKSRLIPFVTFAIHAADRLHEYGVSGIPDYSDRGSRAHLYHLFLRDELIGKILPACGIKHEASQTIMAGCSLGGLSALDFTWQHPDLVSIVAAFSGSFWWRSKALDAGYTQADRIMHRRINETPSCPAIAVWLQAGTDDEKTDRTGSGVIDTIADIHDLMIELTDKGFSAENLVYHEIEKGRHNQETWGKALPIFLAWAFNKLPL